VEVITGTDQVLIIDIYDPLMVGAIGSDLQIMQVFQRYGISYIFKATSANSISLVIWEKHFTPKLIEDLAADFEQVTTEPVAIVCMIGSNMDQPGVLAKAASALAQADINIVSAGFSLKKVNIQFIVARQDFRQAIVHLNRTMYF
jgi:aspartate kinase